MVFPLGSPLLFQFRSYTNTRNSLTSLLGIGGSIPYSVFDSLLLAH